MVRLTDRPDRTLDVYRGRKTTMQQQPAVHYHKQLQAKVELSDSLKLICTSLILSHILRYKETTLFS